MTRAQRCVWVVEDNDRDYELIESALALLEQPPEVVRCADGDECMERIRTHPGPGDARPQLVLLDLNMPGYDGRDLLAEIRASRYWRGVPVAILSTSSNPRDVAFCYGNGASSYHFKAMKIAEFRNMVKTVAAFWLHTAVALGPTDFSP